MKKLVLIFGALALTLWGLPQPPAAAKPRDRVDGQLILKLKTGSSQVTQAINDDQAEIIRRVNRIGALIVKAPPGRIERLRRALASLPDVEYVEPDYLAWADFTPNDTYYAPNQWGLNNTGQTVLSRRGYADDDIDAPEAWDKTQGFGVKVAVLDTGVDQNHPDLAGKLSDQSNFTDSSTIDDIYGHGTHVTGIVAAVTNNGTGVASGCPDCLVMNGKVLGDDGSGAYSWIANGIVWASDNGAKVINLSLGGAYPSTLMEQAVNYAWSKGVVVVAAAGNSGSRRYSYPAAYANAIAVAATDNRDRKASFSNYGYKWVDVAAPGVSIYSTLPNHPTRLSNSGYQQNYDYLSGTSMAAPMTSAVAALIWSTAYGPSGSAVRSRLESTADRISGTGNYWAYGRVNANRAVSP